MRKGYIYPQTWKSGADEERHEIYNMYKQHRYWANSRKEPYLIEFEEWVQLLSPPHDPDKWKRYGKSSDGISVYRMDKTEPWTRHNVIACTIAEFNKLRRLRLLSEKYHKLEVQMAELALDVEQMVSANTLRN